ncbi:T9SS type A sorting domain-containing protein [Bacteroidota bacterium]
MKVNDEGELEVETELGNVKFTSPIAYQEYEKKREYIDVEYRIEGQCYGFTVGNYDHEQTLVIDPLIASTFIGGSGEEAGWSGDKIAVDEEGNIFFGGTTRSVNFPVSTGVIQENLQGNQDIFIAKFDSKLENLLACTYLGGTGNEERFSIQYKSGSLYVMGTSSSNDYPTTNGAYNRNYSGGNMDVFISRLNSELNILEASTYIGGSSDDKACSFSVGNEDGIYIAGSTNSTNFPTTLGAYDRSYNGGGQVGDIFLARINYDLSQIQMSTYFGGGGNEGSDGCCFIEIGNNGNIYIAGQTMSDDLPITPGAYDNSIGGWGDIFLSCFSSNLGTLISSTYLGGSGGDMPWDLAVDENNNPIICSHIESTDYPVTQNSYDPTHNGGLEMAITKLNSGLTEIIASTWVGGNSNDCPFSMKINEAGSIFVSGFTSSSDFPATAGSYDETYNNETDVFVLNINNDLSELIASTFIGGSSNDWLGWINLDNESNVIVGGFTSSSDFPTQLNSYDRSYNGGGDYFISILDSELSEPTYIISASAGDGGSISPLGEIQISWRGEISFTIAADEGYKISDVLVDGVSVGVVEQYVFEDVIEDHTIEALFEDNTSSAGFNNFEINVCENFPNPFTENTNFKFEIASPTDVSINIFNISGRLIRKVVDNCIFNNGTHTISWDAIDNEGNRIIPGIYFWNIKLNSFNSTGKIIYI